MKIHGVTSFLPGQISLTLSAVDPRGGPRIDLTPAEASEVARKLNLAVKMLGDADRRLTTAVRRQQLEKSGVALFPQQTVVAEGQDNGGGI